MLTEQYQENTQSVSSLNRIHEGELASATPTCWQLPRKEEEEIPNRLSISGWKLPIIEVATVNRLLLVNDQLS